MKMKMSLRMLSLAALAVFVYSLLLNGQAVAKDSTDSKLIKASIAASASPTSIPCEEKEDSDDSSHEKRDVILFEVSSFRVQNSHHTTDNQQHRKLTHVTYCIGNLLYLAHRRVLI
jgi:hypothetical protein